MQKLTTSVILCTRNRLQDIVRCLESLQKQTALPTEIIVVDSSDTCLNEDKQFNAAFSSHNFSDTQLQYMHTQPGLTYQRNRGIEKAHGEIIYFFDDDVVLEKDYLAQMNKAFIEHPEYAGGIGDITNIGESSWKYRLFRKIFLLPRERASGNFTWSGMPTHPFGTKKFKQIEVFGGCCMAFRGKILEKFKFDESFKGYAYMEDCDISRRVSLKYKLFFNPQAKLVHLESPQARDKITDNARMFIRNYTYLFFRNFYSHNRLKLGAFFWSIIGLFAESLLMLNRARMLGFWSGMIMYYRKK